jgi:4-hydroxy-tetrahydrodipicolinate reductase
MIKIGLVGLTGRMGQEIHLVLQNYESACFVAGCSSTQGSMEQVFSESDIVIDFSTPQAFFTACEFAKKYNKPLVSGTTGFTAEQEEQIKQLSQNIVLVLAANMSLGVNLFFKFAKQMAQVLKNYSEYDIEIVETHHINKKDAPSGTAITLGKKVAEGIEQNFNEIAKYGRNLTDEKKAKNEIGFSSIRSGGIVGEHTLIFGSKDDRIEITHKAYNRAIFAKGAVDLAVKVFNTKNLKNGLYEYGDFL